MVIYHGHKDTLYNPTHPNDAFHPVSVEEGNVTSVVHFTEPSSGQIFASLESCRNLCCLLYSVLRPKSLLQQLSAKYYYWNTIVICLYLFVTKQTLSSFLPYRDIEKLSKNTIKMKEFTSIALSFLISFKSWITFKTFCI